VKTYDSIPVLDLRNIQIINMKIANFVLPTSSPAARACSQLQL